MLKLTFATFAASALSTLVASGAVAQERTAEPGKIYQLVSRYSGKCLDVTDHALTEGKQLQQWNCTGKSNQKFKVIDAYKGAIQLVAQESGLYVKVADESLDNGGIVVQSSNNSGNSPRLILTPSAGGSYTVKFANSGKCLDVSGPSTDAGAKMHQWDCHGGANQDWRLVEQTSGAGQKAWEVNGSSLFVDSFKRLYRQGHNGFDFAAVDSKTGHDLWTYHGSTYETPYTSCNDQNHIYLLAQGSLKALNPNDGKQLWKFDSSDQAGSLYCVEGYNSIFLSASSTNDGKFRSIERETGRQRWEYKANGFTNFIGKQGQNILLTVSQGNVNNLVNLESGTGRVKWTRALKEGEYVTSLAKGDVIINRPNALEKVNVENGSAAWTYNNGSNGELYLAWNAAGTLYARSGREVFRLNSSNGSVLWSHTIPESIGNSNSSATILKNGDLFLRTTDTSNTAPYTAILDASGRKLWESSSIQNGYLLEDNAGKLFIQGQRSLTSLDRNSGESVWTFSREFPLDNESFYGAETYGNDVYVLYGISNGRYPSMGIVRLDAKSGAQQWDVWTNETTSLIFGDNDNVYTNRSMGGGYKIYKR